MVDCLYLLTDHFNQLRTMNGTICYLLHRLALLPHNKEKLPKLKCFTFEHKFSFHNYNERLIQLLHRMSNLEQLNLHFENRSEPIIDGNHLDMKIVKHLTKLNQFTFNIRSAVRRNNHANLPTNDDIQNTFQNFANNNSIISYVSYLTKSKLFYTHIYSYPYTWITYDNITNNFPGGLFKSVRKIVLHDEQPFEYAQVEQARSFTIVYGIRNRQPGWNFSSNCSILSINPKTNFD